MRDFANGNPSANWPRSYNSKLLQIELYLLKNWIDKVIIAYVSR